MYIGPVPLAVDATAIGTYGTVIVRRQDLLLVLQPWGVGVPEASVFELSQLSPAGLQS